MKNLALLFSSILCLLVVSLASTAQSSVNSISGKPALVPDEIVVIFDKSMGDSEKKAVKDKYGMQLKAKSAKARAFSVYKHKSPKAIIEKLEKEKGVVSAQQNAYAYMFATPDDPYYSPYQWHLTRIGLEGAWETSIGTGVVVAIIDTGVRQSLEDLAGTAFELGYDFVNNDSDPSDDEGHGSHVAGTVAQTTNNQTGCAGVAYGSTIMPIKVLDSRGSGTYTAIVNGINYAVDNGADVINLSLGGSGSLDILENAVNYAWANGVVVVCAAGNESSSAPFYPAAYENAISVTATGGNDALASYSNYGSSVDISAPGGDYGDYNGDTYDDLILQNTFSGSTEGYYFNMGTSMASPHVAGVAALVKAANGSLSNIDIRNLLETTAEELGPDGWDDSFGHGLVDASAAVHAAASIVPANIPPVASFTYTVNYPIVDFIDSSDDADGSIASWAWNFGDNTATSISTNPSHEYSAAGTYRVTLTVTDDEGASSGLVSQDVTVTDPADLALMHVDDIRMLVSRLGRKYLCTATITVEDANGNAVSGATVAADWSGAFTGAVSGDTGADGTVTFVSPRVKSTDSFTLTVTGVSHSSLQYDSSIGVPTATASY